MTSSTRMELGATGSTATCSLTCSRQPPGPTRTSPLFEADYCAGRPKNLDGSNPGGAYIHGGYEFDAFEVKRIHPYYLAGAARPTLPGVGIKLTLFPDNKFYPYDQITCLGDDWVDAGMSGWFGEGCASGDDGIYCIEPDTVGANDVILDRLDFAGSTSDTGNSVVKGYQTYGSYPVGSLIINTFFSVAGDHGYCDKTLPYSSDDGFCNAASGFTGYCVITRFSNVAYDTDSSWEKNWDTYDAQASAEWSSVCGSWGGMFHSLDMLTTPDGLKYSGWPLPMKSAWTRILPCDRPGRRLETSAHGASNSTNVVLPSKVGSNALRGTPGQ